MNISTKLGQAKGNDCLSGEMHAFLHFEMLETSMKIHMKLLQKS